MRRPLWLLFVVGCGGVTIWDFQDEAIDARCQYLTRCGLFESFNVCKSQLDAMMVRTSIAAAFDAGKLHYDEDIATDCLHALRERSCSQTARLDPKCQDILTGTIADGGMCAFDDECLSGRCAVEDCTMACCPGTCTPAPPTPNTGEMCQFACQSGAYCGADSLCHGLLPKGAACDAPFACGDGLYCDGLTGMMSGTCAALPNTDDACVEQCLNIGDYCDGTCKKLGLTGAACMNDDQCSPYYECDATMKCAQPMRQPLMRNGSTCTSNVQCESHYCGNDDKCSNLPVCI